jgi:hypothetical protein
VIRTTAVERETEELMKTDPEAAILRWQTAALGAERDAMHEVVSGQLAGSDPWRFLELSASMKGSLPTSDAVARSLSFASKSDPQRVLALLPEIAARYHGYNGARGFADDILAGWIETDAVGAIRWAGEAGIWLNSDDLANATTTPETALELFSDPNRSVQVMAKGALRQHVETGLADGSAEELLEKIPPDAADDLMDRRRCHRARQLRRGHGHRRAGIRRSADAGNLAPDGLPGAPRGSGRRHRMAEIPFQRRSTHRRRRRRAHGERS